MIRHKRQRKLHRHPLSGYKLQFTDNLAWVNDVIRCTLEVLKRKKYHGHTEFTGITRGGNEAVLNFDASMFLNRKSHEFLLVFKFHQDRMWIIFGDEWNKDLKFGKLYFRKGSMKKTRKETVFRINQIYDIFKRKENERDSEYLLDV